MTLADIMQSVIQGSPDGPLVDGALRSLGGDEATPSPRWIASSGRAW
jgi:hypothetical protein